MLSTGLSTSLATGSCVAEAELLRDRVRLAEPGGLGLDTVWGWVGSRGLWCKGREESGLDWAGRKGDDLGLAREQSERVGMCVRVRLYSFGSRKV